MAYYLGYDASTQGVKVSVYDADMRCVASANHLANLRYPGPGMVEMDPEEYVSLTVRGMRECTDEMRRLGHDPDDIRSVFGDGIICGITGIGEDGRAVTPFINYLDSRTQADADSINALGLDIWGEQTGNADATCLQPAMFARWFLANVPGFRKNGAKFVHNGPYIGMRLCDMDAGQAYVDQGAMSGWGLGYDVVSKRWSPEQLEILGIDEDMMPKVLKPWNISGHVSEEMAAAAGIPAGTPVCAGAGDTMQSMLGCGLFGPGMAADVSGTCAMFCVSTDGIVPELSGHGSGLVFNSGSLDGTYFYWGYIRAGGLALRWFRDNVSQEDYPIMSAAAEKVPAGSDGVLFLPYLTGGTGAMNGASGCFLNMGMNTDRATMWRSVLESIGFEYMAVADLYRSAGVDLSKITIAEGGSRDDLWNQIKADMLGCETRVMKAGGAMLTNCAMAAHAVGDLKGLESFLKERVSADRSFLPDERNTAMYRRMYDVREKVLGAMTDRVFPDTSSIMGIR